jgi:hypothetical protein
LFLKNLFFFLTLGKILAIAEPEQICAYIF